MTRRELWEMIGEGRAAGSGGGGVVGGKDVNRILSTCFLIYCSFFVLKRPLKKKNGQVLNKPQMRPAKNFWRNLCYIKLHIKKKHKKNLKGTAK